MRLATALRLTEGEVVALVGAPARTTALFRLADDVLEAGGRVITAAADDALPVSALDRAPRHFSAFAATRAAVEAALERHRHVLVTGPVDRAVGRVTGVSAGLLEDVLALPDLTALLVQTSPPIPALASRVLMVREAADPAALSWPDLGRPVTLYLNTPEPAEAAPLAEAALKMAEVEAVLVGNLRKVQAVHTVHARVGAIVLAAGRSTRMGRSKPLLPWGATTLLGAVVERLRATPVAEIVVVTGADREAVEASLMAVAQADPRVRPVFNPEFAAGEMARSLQTGLRALHPQTQAALVALADQPDLDPAVAAAVIARWRATLAPIVAPSHGEVRGHPLLFDRAVWPRVLALPLTANPREVVQAVGVEAVPVAAPAILTDIDTPEDYARAHPTPLKR